MNEKIKQYREEITARMVDALKQGTAPWMKPWNGDGAPRNATTGRHYTGANTLVLSSIGLALDGGRDPRWLTFKQAAAKGWNVMKGAHGTKVSFWKNLAAPLEDGDGNPIVDDAGSIRTAKSVMMEKLFTVFHASQVEGIDAYSPVPINAVEANEKAERIIADSEADIRHAGFRAFYSPDGDFIQLPEREFFFLIPPVTTPLSCTN